MTIEDNWYKNRILWKANKNELFSHNCIEFKDLDTEYKEFIINLIPKNKIPVIIFFNDINQWTLLCTDNLYTYNGEELVSISKDDMCQKFIPTINQDESGIVSSKEKRDVQWLYATKSKKSIWFPSSTELWNFWSILQMLCKLK